MNVVSVYDVRMMKAAVSGLIMPLFWCLSTKSLCVYAHYDILIFNLLRKFATSMAPFHCMHFTYKIHKNCLCFVANLLNIL